MKISIVRGAFLNPFELQNYVKLSRKFEISAISSKFPICTDIKLPLTRLWSPTDLPNFPYKYALLNRLFTDAHYLFGLEDVIKGSDIVHTAETYFHYTHQALLAKKQGLISKVVSTCWEIIPHNNEGITGRKDFKTFARKNVDHFLCPTFLAKKALTIEGVDTDKVSVIRMGVDLTRFRPYPSKKPGVRILFVGRLVEEKGVSDLLEAYRLCKAEGFDISLTFVGSGPLESRARNMGCIVKQVPYETIHKEYQKADIFCLPSKNTPTWQEQYGMVLVEAMACALPIITTRNGAIPEVCGRGALYISGPHSLAGTIKNLHKNREQLNRLGKYNLERVKKEFDANKIANKIRKLYLSI